jgi:hypothetical protein
MTKCKSLSRRALHSAPRSRKGDRAAQQRGGRGDSLNASSSAARPLHHASHGPPPPHCVRGRIKQNPSRDAVGRPSFAHHHHAEKALLPVTERGKRSAERRMQAMSALTRGCATVTPPSPACGGGLGGGRGSALFRGALAFRRFTAVLVAATERLDSAQAALRTSGRTRLLPASSIALKRSTPLPGRYAGRDDARTARERGYKPRPQEPHSLRDQVCLEITSLWRAR